MDWLWWALRMALELLAGIGLVSLVIGGLGLVVYLLAGGFSEKYEGRDFSGLDDDLE